MLEVGGYKQKREIRKTFYMGGSGTLVDGIRRWFQRRSNHNNHDHINNTNKTTSDVSSSGCPQSSVNVKEGIKGTEEEQLTVIEDFDISDLKLIRVPKRIHFPPGSTMDLQKKVTKSLF